MERIELMPSTFKPSVQKKQEERSPLEIQQQFSKMLANAIDQVNDAQINADVKTKQLVNNEINDLHEVMIAAEKASVTMQITMEVRNKVVEAYQEVMRMQL